jgi:hypothetical protein
VGSKLLAVLGVGLLLAGCQARGLLPSRPASQGGAPPAATPAAPAVERRLRVAVVDIVRATRSHPRWPELQALDRRIADLQAQLAVPQVTQIQVPRIDLGPQMKVEVQRQVDQMRPEFRREYEQEATSLQGVAKRELDAYAAQVRADQQGRFDARRAELEAQARKAVADKQQEFAKDNDQFQRQTLEQYRLPLLNLRLKLENVQQTNKQEGDQLTAQVESLTKERDDKIAAHEKTNQQALDDFQKQQSQTYIAALKTLEQQLSKEGQALIDQKAAEINSRMHTQLQAREVQLNAQLNTRLQTQLHTRQQALVAGAREQVVRAQTQAQAGARTRQQALRAQLLAVQEQRARLLGSIFADLRIEAATLATQNGYDVILTQTVAAVDTVDVTDGLIARLKR